MRTQHETAYYEKHHIMPDFMFIQRKRPGPRGHLPGDPDSAENLVYLTAREHLLSHMLLTKIYKSTSYEFSCLTSLALMLNISPQLVNRNVAALTSKYGNSRIYAKRKEEYANRVSKQWKNTIVAKDAITNEMIGHVDLAHPNVLSGKWVHHTKGTTLSKSHKAKIKIATTGLNNGNSKGYTDMQLTTSYEECCKEAGFIVHGHLWIQWAKINDKPYLIFFKPFRFNGNGFNDMRKAVETRLNMKFDQKMYNRKNSKKLYNEFKEKIYGS